VTTFETEEQQVEALKKWWREYSKAIITGGVIGFAVLFGSRMWFNHQHQQAVSASMEYEQLRAELADGNGESVAQRANYLMDTFPDSPYAVAAAFALAKIKVESGSLDEAGRLLNWSLDHATLPEYQQIARLRLARVLLAQEESGQALTLLGQTDPEPFASAYQELRGDIYQAQGKVDEAREAYQRALDLLADAGNPRLLQMKLDELGDGSAN